MVRTFPDNKKIVRNHKTLENVLNVLAVKFEDMGYIQGMNYIIA